MKKVFTGRLLIAVICVVLGMVPLLTLANTIESGRSSMKKSFAVPNTTLVKVKLNGASASYEAFEKLSKEMPEIVSMLPISKQSMQISSYKNTDTVTLKAVNNNFPDYAGVVMIKGSFITADNMKSNTRVMVIDDLTADKLFGTTSVVGDTIDIALAGIKQEVTIIGICKRLDISDGDFKQAQGLAYIPISLLEDNLQQYEMQEVILSVKGIQIEECKVKIAHFLNNQGIVIDKDNIDYASQIEPLQNFAHKYLNLLIVMALLWFILAMAALTNIFLFNVEQDKNYYGLLKFYGNGSKKIRYSVYNKAFETAAACSAFSLILGLLSSYVTCRLLNIHYFISIHSITIGVVLPLIICMCAVLYPAVKASKTDINSTIWQLG